MNLLDHVKRLGLEINRIEQAKIVPCGGKEVLGYHSTVFGQGGIALGGGCSFLKDVSMRIAIAESLERSWVEILKCSSDAESFSLDEFPTTCGFAAGFDREKTNGRSVLEALERWAWSQWIDRGFFIPEVFPPDRKFSALCQYFRSSFEKVRFFSIELPTEFGPVRFNVALGFVNGGVFPGSRMVHVGDNEWGHSLLEAWRHLVAYRNLKKIGKVPATFVDKRIVYFGENAEEALVQVGAAKRASWLEPKISVQKNVSFDGLHLYRSICSDFDGWHLGGESRFVY